MSDEQADEQATFSSFSHDEDGVGAGGRNGYPSDSQTTLKKLYVRASGDRDQAPEVPAPEASRPISSRTRSSERRRMGESRVSQDPGCSDGIDDMVDLDGGRPATAVGATVLTMY